MRVLLQRVAKGQVLINNEVVGVINKGLVLLVGVCKGDNEYDADYLIEKCLNLRVFEDSEGKMNRSVIEENGGILVVSQFTLHADTRKGRRPSFSQSALPNEALFLYEYFVNKICASGLEVSTGCFGADMKVDIINDGPVTIMIDSEDKYPK
ncbi:MAG: D-aminoacyl-tRNA deacylase [Lentisphaeria bacterium]